MKMCRHCGSRSNRHARGCKYDRCVSRVPVARREKAPKPVAKMDDEFLLILALRMAAYHTLREDLRPRYLRLAEERDAIRKLALEAIQ